MAEDDFKGSDRRRPSSWRGGDDWPAFRELVLFRLERLEEAAGRSDDRLSSAVRELKEAIGELKVSDARLWMKVGLWGVTAGSLPAIAATLWLLFKGHSP